GTGDGAGRGRRGGPDVVREAGIVSVSAQVRDLKVHTAPTAAGQRHNASVMRSGEPPGGIREHVVRRDNPVEPLPLSADRGPGVWIEVHVVADSDQGTGGTRPCGRCEDKQDNPSQKAGSGSDSPD